MEGQVAPDPHKSGYLFERKNGRVYQTWSRKYYTIADGELICTPRNPKVRNCITPSPVKKIFFVDFHVRAKKRMA